MGLSACVASLSSRQPMLRLILFSSDMLCRAAMREAANPIYAPPALGPNDKVSGWVGTPDPSKFATGTNSLTPEEVREEVAKGNIVMLDDWAARVRELQPWEQKALFDAVVVDWTKNRSGHGGSRRMTHDAWCMAHEGHIGRVCRWHIRLGCYPSDMQLVCRALDLEDPPVCGDMGGGPWCS